MKTSNKLRRTTPSLARFVLPLALASAVSGMFLSTAATAATLTWDANGTATGVTDGGGTWSSTNINWWDGASDAGWTATTGTAVFGNNNGAAGTVTVSGSMKTAALVFNAAGSGNYTLTGGTVSLPSSSTITTNVDATINSTVIGATWTKAGSGMLVLGGSNNFGTNAITMSAGTLRVTSTNSLGSSALPKFGANGVALQFHIDGGGTLNFSNSLQFASAATGGTGTIDVDNNGTGTNGVISVNGASSAFAAPVSTLNITGGHGYSLYLADFNVTTTSTGTSTLNPTTANLSIGNLRYSAAATSGTHVFVLDGTSTGNSVVGNITEKSSTAGAVAITKSNSGIWVLSGTNSYTNVTKIKGGTLQFAKTLSLYSNTTSSWTDTNIVVGSGATAAFNVGGTGEFTATNIDTLKSLGTSTGGFETGAILGLDTTNAGGTFTYDSAIANPNGGSNTLGLTKLGAGALVLTASSSYTGVTTVSGGTLKIQDGSIANSSSITNNSVLEYNLNNNARTYGNAIGGTGSLVKSGTNVFTLSGANTYSGATTVSGGLIQLNVAENAGTNGPLGKPGTLANSIVLNGGGLQFTTNNTYDYTTSGRLQLADGATGTIDTNGQTVTFAHAIGVDSLKTGALTKTGAGNLTLSAANTYTGATTVNSGTLALGINNAITTTSDLTIGGASSAGVLDMASYTNTIKSLTIAKGGGTVKLVGSDSAAPLVFSSGTLTLTGNLTLDLAAMSSPTLGRYHLISSGTSTGGGSVTTANANSVYNLLTLSNGTGYDLQHKADQTLTITSPATINIITGATTAISATLTNSAPSSSAALAAALTDNAGSGGAVTDLSSSAGSTVGAQASSTIGGTFTAGSVGTGKTWSIKNTDAGAVTTSHTAGGTVNIYNHANGVLTLTSGTTVNAITGATINSSLSFQNSGANNVKLTTGTLGGGLSGLSGDVTANQTVTDLAGSFTAGAAGTTGTNSYTAGYTEDATVIGRTTGTSTATANVVVNSYNHANGVLSLTSASTVDAIAGATINSTLSLQNSGANNVKLTVGSLGGNLSGLSGDVLANGTQGGTGSFSAGAAGTSGTHSYTAAYTEDTSVTGHNSGGTATANVVVNSYNHANGVLSLTSASTVDAIAGATINSTLSLQNSGANNVKLTVGSLGGNLSGLSGDVLANGTQGGTGSFSAGAAGTSGTHSYTAAYTEDTSVTGHNSGGTATANVVVNSYNHANGVLSLTSASTVDAIAGATINSTLSLQNSGANNVKLTVGSLGGNLSGLSGDVLANGTQGGTGSFSAGAAGTSGTHSYTAAYTEDTSVTGHNSGGTATAGVTVNSYDHAILAQADTTNAGSIDTFNVSNLVNGSARRAAADVSNISLSTSATGFTKGSTGLVASDATRGIASFDTSDKLNGTYKVTASITATSKTASGGVITGASANDAGMSNVALSEVVGGKTAGAGVTKVAGIAAGTTYGGYNMTSTMEHGTKAELLGGTATADATVSMTFNTAEALSITDNASRVSDIVSISGMHQTGTTGEYKGSTLTDTFVLQLNYTGSDPAYLAWWDGSAFVNAIAGNSTVEGGSGITGFGLGFGNYHANVSYTNGDYSALGNYGYDASNHVAWAVVDHNSDFVALSAVPEPSTWAMLVGGFGMLGFVQRLRRRFVQ